MLKDFPFLHAMHRRSGLDWSGREILAVFVLIGIVAISILLLWPMVLHDLRQERYDAIAGFLFPLFWIVLIGGGLLLGWRRARYDLAHEIGLYGDVKTIAARIEADFKDREWSASPLQIGHEWLCYVRGETSFVLLIGELAWVYVEGGPKGDSLVFHTRRGSRFSAFLGRTDPLERLYLLRSEAPSIAYGFTAALYNTWMEDRADLLALIDRARAEGVPFASIADPRLTPPRA